MKRSPLNRRTPLKAKTGVKAVSVKRRKRDAVYPEARASVHERADGRCEAMITERCTMRCEQVHHVRGRRVENPHALENLLGCCAPCHEFIHGHPEEARKHGLIQSPLQRGDLGPY